MKKLLLVYITLLMVVPVAALAEAEGITTEVAASIDWTALVVAMIGVIGTAISALLGRVWVKYVRPWLEQRDLTDAATIVVEAVEALLGRYCGEEKWRLALEKMQHRGFRIDSDLVMDALNAAWKQLDMSMIAAGEKDAPKELRTSGLGVEKVKAFGDVVEAVRDKGDAGEDDTGG